VVDGLILELIIWHFRCLRDGIAGQGFRPPREPWVRKIPLHPAQAEEKHQGLGFLTKRSGSRAIKKKKKKNQLSVHSVDIVRFEWQSSALCKLLVFIGGRY
jgi:hypothetical protein